MGATDMRVFVISGKLTFVCQKSTGALAIKA